MTESHSPAAEDIERLLAASSLAPRPGDDADAGVDMMFVHGSQTRLVQCKAQSARHPAAAANGEALEELLSDTYRAMVYRYACSRLVDAAASEELTSEVLRVASRRLRDDHAHRQDLGALLVGIARQLANRHEDLLRQSTGHWSPTTAPAPWQTPRGPSRSGGADTSEATYPDKQASRAVLVGASRYGTLPELAAARRGAERLADVLAGAVGRQHITVLFDDAVTRDGVLRALQDAADQTTDTLVLYWCGHGRAARDTLLLGTADTDPADTRDALSFKDLHRLTTRSQARRHLTILDTCAAGSAARQVQANYPALNRPREEYLLAATGSRGWAMAGADQPYSAFTAALIDVLTGGVPDASADLDLPTVQHAVARKLASATLPKPMMIASGGPPTLILSRNRWAVAAPGRTAGPPQDLAAHSLLQDAKNGDSDALRELAARHSRLVWTTCRGLRLAAAEAEEVSRAVWIRLGGQISAIADPSDLAPWITQVTRAEALTLLQQRRALVDDAVLPDAAPDIDLHERTRELVRQLTAEFAVLRRGWGVGSSSLSSKVGPNLTRLAGIGPHAPDAEIRHQITALIERLLRGTKERDRVAVRYALGLDPLSRLPHLTERTQELARQLACSERGARRFIAAAFELMAEAATADLESSWYVQRLETTLRLDTNRPELTEQRVIVSQCDGLRRISTTFSAPRQAADPHAAFASEQWQFQALYGARITGREQRGRSGFTLSLDLPTALSRREQHEYSIRLHVPSATSLAPHYVFVPLAPCDSFRLRIRFDPSRPPVAMWRVSAREPRAIYDRIDGPLRSPDAAGETVLQFSDLRQGLAYGVTWHS